MSAVRNPKQQSEMPRVVGQPIARVDGPLKVRGQARFAAEVDLPGLAYAALAYSSIAKGRIVSIDTSAARQAAGVMFVMTHENAPKLNPPPIFTEGGAAVSRLPIMQGADVHWNGQPIAIVVAESQEQAEHAASLIQARFDTEPAVLSLDKSRARAKAHEHILGEPPKIEIGDAESALASAEVRVDRVYRTPRQNHNAIELHAVTVHWEEGTLVVHDSTQMINMSALALQRIFDLPPDKVRVKSPFIGGGFGGKGLWSYQVLAAAVAREVQRPVRLVLSREGVFRSIGGRTLTEQRVALGARKDGALAALIHTGLTGMTSHSYCPEQFTFPARHLYQADRFKIAQEYVALHMVPNTFMRAPGESVGTFALESAIDELAVALQLDPIELRRRLEPKVDPTSRHPFSQRGLIEAYRRGAEKFGWHDRNLEPRSRREGDWLIGHGVATATYPYYRQPGGAARIRLNAEGHAIVQMASHEMGMGTATVQAQFAADLLAVPLEEVKFEYGDSTQPAGTMAGGSSQTASIIGAVVAASEALFAELLRLAGPQSPLAGLEPGEVMTRDRGLCARRDPGRFESYRAILKRAGRQEVSAEASSAEPVEAQKYSMHSTGAQFCEVRVNAITGEIRVSRFLGSFDVGRIVNPKTAASQLRGGIVMGIGLALMEETLFDERTGRIMNASLAEYHVPVHMDVPAIDVIWNDIPDPQSPHGVRGIGEIGITGVGAAIANAVYNAAGVRVRELPITLDKT
ncbi:MAG TPA: xanthine dehydrogenase family protein molybdopterin-binding subunit [Steroidobacter sp.]|uniref:xanthine dehydrogenase family protein molybdopterin-binding subunit n=1 Tax=Steroidobacter sp. TaxID=1978227 RepID=UPI002ED8BB37